MKAWHAGGTARALIDSNLSGLPEFRKFRAGDLDRADFQRVIDQQQPRDWSLNTDQLNLATRFPVNERETVAQILAALEADGFLPTAEYDEAAYERHAARIAYEFDHSGNLTYIFPEEGRLLYAVTAILRPQRALFVGSCYGYWAAFAAPNLASATLIDPDPAVLELSRRNLTMLGADFEFVCRDAVAYLAEDRRPCDLVVRDAEGPLSGPDPDLLDKAIYHPVTVATTPLLRPGGLMVAHNMLLSNLTDNAYFRSRIIRNFDQYAKVHRYIARNYDLVRDFPTTEGVSFYRRAPLRRGGYVTLSSDAEPAKPRDSQSAA